MVKHLSKTLLVSLICFVLLAILAAGARAQTPNPADTPTVTPTPGVLGSGDQILFSQSLNSDMVLTGPFDSNIFLFSLPAGWQLNQAPQIDLSMAVSFNTAVLSNGQTPLGSAGTLTVEMNNILLDSISLNQVGEITQHLSVSLDAMHSSRTDGLMELRFFLDSSSACDFYENLVVRIHPRSFITLPHSLTPPETDLAKFPAPIFQQGLTFNNSALVVIPDNPSAGELQSALTVAAGLGNLTNGSMALDVATMSQLTSQQMLNSHLILVGKASSLSPLLVQLQLPMPAINGQLTNTGGSVDDGVVQLVDSPWRVDKAVLVIAGNTDSGTLKAAQAMSTGLFRINTFQNLSVVQQVQGSPQPVSIPVDQTIQALGYGATTANSLGVNYVSYSFYVPPGLTLGNDAYFELLYGHSALLNYARSGIVVFLNGEPIGSVAFNDTTAHIGVNSVKFTIPPAVIHPGRNSIEVRIDMIPVDRCTLPNLSGTYTNIWPGSNLHLPFTPTITGISSEFDLGFYPAPFVYDPTLSTTAFVLPKGDLQAWRNALGVAEYLGHASQGSVTTLAAFYADNIPATERPKYNLLIIGRASVLPIISELNTLLPAPFENNADLATEPNMQVTFRISPNTTIGYVELLPSPWNSDRVIVAALGNTTQGVAWGASHLIAPLSFTLKGNFAVINDTKVITTDTRIASLAPLVSAAATANVPAVQAKAPDLNPSQVAVYKPGWLLPALMVTVLLIIITILVAVYINWTRNHSGKMIAPLENLFTRNKVK